MAKLKFYAVRHGREGPKIYDSWSQCETAVKGWPGASHKSFPTRQAAEVWLIASDNASASVNANVSHTSNPWSTIVSDGPATHQPSPVPETPPSVPLDVEPFTEDFIPLPSNPLIPDSRTLAPQQPTYTLSDEQEHILSLAQQGKNIFFTGSAGTGKSILLREIILHFGGQVSEELAITASTGIAAVNIGGVTLHSWAGIGLGVESVDKLVQKIMGNKNSRKRWRRTRTLIIDEISMVDGVLYDKLECIARNVRGNDMPFGGIQLVLSGDFCQLPPVPERNGLPILFAFEAISWGKCFDATDGTIHRLTKVFRQRDQSFIDMLNSMRDGKLDAMTSAQFYKLSRPIHYSDGVEPCELFPLREQVREANETRLRRIINKIEIFEATDIGGYDIYQHPVSLDRAKKLLDRSITPEVIKLKVGAQVMLIKNLVQGRLVNGSIGQVVAFQSLGQARGLHTEIAEVDKSKEASKRKSQKDQVEGPLASAADQAAYVDKLWPVVRFLNGRTLLLTPVEFEIVNVNGQMEAGRDQVPLILAWALSIHKSQGQTLERVKVDLGRVFEKGQAYVALSRATNLDALQVLNFHPSKVMAHPRVLEFYERLDRKSAQKSQSTPSIPEPYDEFDELDDEEAMASYYAVGFDD